MVAVRCSHYRECKRRTCTDGVVLGDDGTGRYRFFCSHAHWLWTWRRNSRNKEVAVILEYVVATLIGVVLGVGIAALLGAVILVLGKVFGVDVLGYVRQLRKR